MEALIQHGQGRKSFFGTVLSSYQKVSAQRYLMSSLPEKTIVCSAGMWVCLWLPVQHVAVQDMASCLGLTDNTLFGLFLLRLLL